jgi:hypothetical protein
MSELFKLLERGFWKHDRSAKFGLDFELKQIRKRCCKKSVDHYNANPSLTLIAIKKFWISGLLDDRLKVN